MGVEGSHLEDKGSRSRASTYCPPLHQNSLISPLPYLEKDWWSSKALQFLDLIISCIIYSSTDRFSHPSAWKRLGAALEMQKVMGSYAEGSRGRGLSFRFPGISQEFPRLQLARWCPKWWKLAPKSGISVCKQTKKMAEDWGEVWENLGHKDAPMGCLCSHHGDTLTCSLRSHVRQRTGTAQEGTDWHSPARA